MKRSLLLFVGVGLAYAAGSRLAFTWFGADGTVSSFFPSAGVTLAALVLTRRREWPFVLGGAATAEFVLDQIHGIDVIPTLGYVTANLVEPLVGATLLIALVSSAVDLSRTRHLAAFVLAAVVVAPAVGASLGASTYLFLAGGDGWLKFAGQWWAGDGLGVLVVAGSILALRATRVRPLGNLRLAEGLLLAGVALVATIMVFWFDWLPLVYLTIALLVVIAFRVGTAGVALTGAGIAFIAAEATSEGHTFWDAVGIEPATGVVYLQLALGMLIGSSLALAAEIAQRERAARAWASADSARRESAAVAAHAERLRSLAEAVGHATTSAEVSRVLEQHGFGGVVGLPAPGAAGEGAERYLGESAGRIARDAYARVALLQTEREARMRAELLERHAQGLAAATTIREVAASTVSVMEQAGVEMVGVEGRRGESVEVLAVGGLSPAATERFSDYPLSADTPGATAMREEAVIAVRSGHEYDARFPGTADLRARHGVQAVLAIPLRDGAGRVTGALSAAFADPAFLDDELRQLLDGMAEQTSLALERARLHEQAERTAADAAFLVRLGDVLERATSADVRAERLVVLLEEELGVRCCLRILDEEDAGWRLVAESTTWSASGDGIWEAIPLRARGRTLGALEVRDGGDFSRGGLGREVVARAAIALDNALLYDRERKVSHTLQLGLLGGALEAADGLELGAAYRAGTAALDVGGDWYDAFRLPDGSLALVVGDVVGHGLDAAIVMGQLRGAVRALAPSSDPARLLEQLDIFVETLPDAGMATIAYVEIEPSTGELRYACAGHPPPLVVSPTGDSRFLWDGRSAAIGSMLGLHRVDATDVLGPDETLLLYTDGVVERRSESLDVGLERLALAATAQLRPERLVEHVPDVLLEGQTQDDDVCVLAVRRVPTETHFVHSFPAQPAELAPLRARLRSWLEQAAVDEDAVDGTLLGVSEAAANSIEHGLEFDDSGTVTVEARITAEGLLRITVRDDGLWRERPSAPDRGRGLQIIGAVMDGFTVDTDGAGTVVGMERAVKRVSAV